MPGAQDYALTLDRMCTAVWAGEDPAARPGQGGSGVGRGDRAKSAWKPSAVAYEQFLKLPGCYADHTIETLGMAVHLT